MVGQLKKGRSLFYQCKLLQILHPQKQIMLNIIQKSGYTDEFKLIHISKNCNSLNENYRIFL